MTANSRSYIQKKRRVFEVVADRIREWVASGHLGPGDKLPSERDLATKLNISRPVVREALRTLEQAGVLEFSPEANRGASIGKGSASSLTQALLDLLLVGRISVEELIDVRKLLLEGPLHNRRRDNTHERRRLCRGPSELNENYRNGNTIVKAADNELVSLLIDMLDQSIRYAESHPRCSSSCLRKVE